MEKFTFSEALQLMKLGKAVARRGWKGINGTLDTCVMIHGNDFVQVHKEVEFGWEPNAEEMLAEDWEPVVVSEAIPAIPEGNKPYQRRPDGVYLIAPDYTLVKYGNPADYKGLNGHDFKGVALIVGDMAIRIGLKDQKDVTLTNKEDDGETGSPYYCNDLDQARIVRPNGQADTEHIKAVGTDIELEEGWYIPSLFELYMIFVWRKLLDAALEFIGADPFEDELYWSSTEFSATYAWSLRFTSGRQNYYAKASGRDRVRPVSAL